MLPSLTAASRLRGAQIQGSGFSFQDAVPGSTSGDITYADGVSA